MSDLAMATTPPCPSVLRLPPTPLHGGGYDRYEPYSPRKSTRTKRAQPARQITPEPVHARARTTPAKRDSSTSSNLTSHEQISARAFSPPSSAESTPQKISTKNSKSESQTSSSEIMRNELAPTAPSLGQPTIQPTTLLGGTTMAEGMLPTPVKTPRKKHVPDVNQAARALFQHQPESLDDVMPAPKRGRKNRKYNGFSLESFEAEDGSSEPNIQIFTDSKEKIPEIDESEDNPFYTKPGRAAPPPSHVSKRRKISGGKRDEQVEGAIRRDDGIVFVHRGLKMFRKFEDEGEEVQDDPRIRKLAPEHPGFHMPGPLYRSELKPRLLFPNAAQRREREARDAAAAAGIDTVIGEEDEEADTDIEDENEIVGPHIETDGIEIIDTRLLADMEEQAERKAQAPGTPNHGLAPYEYIMPTSSEIATASTIRLDEETLPSPPAPVRNLRSTRSSTKKAIVHTGETPRETDDKDPKDGKVSPFLGWKRTKSAAAAAAKGKNKRLSDDVTEAVGGSATKKTKAK